MEQYLRDHQQHGLLAFLDGKTLTVSSVSKLEVPKDWFKDE
ncbi:MAG TPA: hypothetical protein VMG10_27680 [Gemmataceae bacterium]|nr:hypothetical protein [Gemmataceae bacterium]